MIDPTAFSKDRALQVEIDLLDKDIVYLIGLRARLVHAVAAQKLSTETPTDTEATVLKAVQRAVDTGAPITVVEPTYRAMLKAFGQYERHSFLAANEAKANGV